ncbi:MAG: MerR family transcriptional regulator [Halioglobus sp.]
MTPCVLESRPLYSIGTVSRLTGIKADTLRIWERRYGLGATKKSTGGRREYTQSDLEHLQIIAALRTQGTRIGDICNLDRKTLELMLRCSHSHGTATLPKLRPRVLFIGEDLADWLDLHPGYLAKVSAFISRTSAEAIISAPETRQPGYDAVFVQCSTIDHSTVIELENLRRVTGANQLVACATSVSSAWLNELKRIDVTMLSLPPNPGKLGTEINRSVIDLARNLGDSDTGELANAKPRQFSDRQLEQAWSIETTQASISPTQLSQLIKELNTFELLSSECPVDNWQESAVNSCVYAYTNQARWLMEKAMQAVLEGQK